MKKIAFFGTKADEEKYLKENLSAKGHGLEIIFFKNPISLAEISARNDFDAISVFTDSVVDRKVLDSLPALKLIVTRSTGYDHIDLDTAKERGIAVSYAPSYGENTVAEFAFALMLALSRKVVFAVNRVKGGQFSCDGLRGLDLNKKTLAVIGTGKIGKNVVRIAKGFEMNVVAFDVCPDTEASLRLGFSYLSLDEALKTADFVTIHVPYLKETHHLIGREKLSLMKKGAFLINTSRGAVIDTEAIFDALKSGSLGGAGLDVLEDEGALKIFQENGKTEGEIKKIVELNQKLIQLENVIVTPHTAFNTTEALRRIWDTTIESLISFSEGKPINLVR